MKIIVASTNPVKINAATEGFKQFFLDEELSVEGVSVSSDVSDQPLSEEETLKGAVNRANNAEKAVPNADYWIGLEGGLEEKDGEMDCFAWIVIKDKTGKLGKGRTGSFFLPEKISALVKKGKELGEADDIVFGQKNSKQGNGTVGNLTKNVITRTSYYVPAVVFALVPFINKDLY